MGLCGAGEFHDLSELRERLFGLETRKNTRRTRFFVWDLVPPIRGSAAGFGWSFFHLQRMPWIHWTMAPHWTSLTILVLARTAKFASADRCSAVVSSGDAAVGIRGSIDVTCASGGLGCFSATCRFCKVYDTAQSSYLLPCASIASVAASTSATQAPASASVTQASYPSPVAAADICAATLSHGDATAGINALTDSTCQGGGLGCFGDQCRYCKMFDTAQSSYLLPCSAIATVPTLPLPATTPVTAPIPQIQVQACASSVSLGDAAAGVSAMSDPTCANGGLGCFSADCRYCKVYDTAQSSYLVGCHFSSPPSPSPTPVRPTNAPTPLTSPPTRTPPRIDGPPPAFDLTCRRSVSAGDASVGIDIATDVSCTFGGVGCISDVCRYCQVWTSSASANFILCPNISRNNGQDIWFTPLAVNDQDNGIVVGAIPRPELYEIVIGENSNSPDLTSVDRSACTNLISSGDIAVGISAIVDTSCLDGGLGCFSPMCRYCKEYDTAQSSYLQSCDYASLSPAVLMQAEPKRSTPRSGSVLWAVGGAIGSLTVAGFALYKTRRRSARDINNVIVQSGEGTSAEESKRATDSSVSADSEEIDEQEDV